MRARHHGAVLREGSASALRSQLCILREDWARSSVRSWMHGRKAPRCHAAPDAEPLNQLIVWKTHMTHEKLGVVIGVGNHKGGVSKSSSATYLASALGERKLKVL